MKIAFIGCSATGKTTLARFVSEAFDLPINPVGSRSVAASMGFVGLDGEGRPYDVDRASRRYYEETLEHHARLAAELTDEQVAGSAWPTREAMLLDYRKVAAADALRYFDPNEPRWRETCRPLFQARLAEAKIAWETQPVTVAPLPNDPGQTPGTQWNYRAALDGGFVTDRTPLDDMAYALLHCPEVVTKEFVERAYIHCENTYDVVYYIPLSAGQWLGDDAARVTDPMYHWRCDVLLQGLMSDCNAKIVEVWETGLDDRKEHVRQSVAANRERNLRLGR